MTIVVPYLQRQGNNAKEPGTNFVGAYIYD